MCVVLVGEIVSEDMQSDANVELPKALKICMFLILVRDFVVCGFLDFLLFLVFVRGLGLCPS